MALRLPNNSVESVADHLEELAALADSLDISVVERVVQARPAPEAATWIGAGKAQEIKDLAAQHNAGLVIFDDELSPGQLRNLEKIIGTRIITRTELILDIFANKARTYEAKLQVELAQLEFSLTRLRHLWSHLEGQRGGIGVRGGAGERQIEVDRRQVRSKITLLKKRLVGIRDRRTVQRGARLGFPVGAVVGYTNVGKSTLVNRVAGTKLYTENKLFATLDAATRRVEFEGGVVLLTDTVGFIRKFPPQLAASFRSTIEEALDADFLVHVADASHPGLKDQIETVEKFLAEMGADRRESAAAAPAPSNARVSLAPPLAGALRPPLCEAPSGRSQQKPVIKLLNKADLVRALDLRRRNPDIDEWIPVSATTGAGMNLFRDAIRRLLKNMDY